MKRVFILLVLIIIVSGVFAGIACRLYFSPQNTSAGAITEVVYGGVFPPVDVYTSTGEKSDIRSPQKKYKVVFCLSDTCHACVEKLVDISRIMKIFESEDVSFHVLWEGSIPEIRAKKAGVDMAVNYSLHNKTKLSGANDFSFILDQNNRVIFTTQYSYNALIEKMRDLEGRADYRDRAGQLITDDALSRGTFALGKGYLLAFYTDNSQTCETARKTLQENDALKQKYNIINIEKTAGTYEGAYIDNSEIYSRVYNINAYPHFVVAGYKSGVIMDYGSLEELLRNEDPTGKLPEQPVNLPDANTSSAYKFSSAIGTSTGMVKPQGLVFLDGNLLVADSGRNRLLLLDKSGKLIKQIGRTGNGKGEFIHPLGLALDNQKNIYVVDSGNFRVQKLDSSGDYLAEMPIDGFKDSAASHINDIAVDSSNNVYVSAYTFDKPLAHIYAISPGKKVKKLGKDLSGHLVNFSGRVFFVSEQLLGDSAKTSGKRSLLELSKGRIIHTFTLPDKYIPRSIFAGDNELYLLDSGDLKIDSFDFKGRFKETLFQSDFKENQGISYFTLDDDKNIYLSDTWKNAIYKFERNK